MINIKRLVTGAVLILSIYGLAMAQDAHNSKGSNSDSAEQHHMDPATMVKHLSDVFPQVAAYDLNKNGKIDDSEKQALGKALADGKVQLPAHTPPGSAQAKPEQMLNHIVDMYGWVSTYDVNKNGKLDESEQAALKTAAEKGEFPPHGAHSHEGAPHQ